MRSVLLPVLALVAGLLPPAVRAADEEDPLLAALKKPPATGLLVTSVVAGSQAEAQGVVVGSVLVSYGGVETRTPEDVARAKEATKEQEAIEAVFVVGERRVVVSFAPGPIGVRLLPVTKDAPPEPLPPATDVKLDFSSLRDAPRDEWFVFTMGGKHVGFEHGTVRLEDGRLVLRREVAFDGGEPWGLNHFDVTVVANAAAWPEVVSTRFENVLDGSVGEGRLSAVEGKREWRFESRKGESAEGVARTGAGPARMLPSYLVETLASFMPRVPGACLHYRPLSEGSGDVDLPAALVSIGEMPVKVGDRETTAWRLQEIRIGGQAAAQYFLDGAGRVVVADYGGPIAYRATKEEALAGLSEKLVPRTAR